MPQGDRWRLPDGREAIEADRTARLLKVLPILAGPPFMGAAELVWRGTCTKLPSRYLHGAVPAEPIGPHG
jgi:hypothetical protein